MREIIGRITISRYSKVFKRIRHDDPFSDRPFWYLWITRLYSGVRYFEGEYKTKNDGFFSDWKFYIAVKELIIEWEDYQAEIEGYVHCKACEDLIDQSEWFNHCSENSNSENSDINRLENPNDSKQLLRFVKSPGLKTTNIKVQKEDLQFFPVNLKQCGVESVNEEEIVVGKSLQVRREHRLDCEIRPLFDNQRLPIANAHITVEREPNFKARTFFSHFQNVGRQDATRESITGDDSLTEY